MGLKRWLWLILFGAAFAFIESSVVVYLREIFYPEGFLFPIQEFKNFKDLSHLFIIETGREAATIVLILSASVLMSNKLRHRIGYFLAIFAIWDIFYYIWLKVLLDWPIHYLDWDILFFIPVTWASPFIAPILTSVLMIFISLILFSLRPLTFNFYNWISLTAAVLAIIIMFCIGGKNISQPNYDTYFSWPLFIIAHIAIVIIFLNSLFRKA